MEKYSNHIFLIARSHSINYYSISRTWNIENHCAMPAAGVKSNVAIRRVPHIKREAVN